MSKRDQGASVQSYIEGGYAPEAVINYLCLLGWSPKDNREKLAIEEVIPLFELANVNRRNAHFDLDKCFWLNGQYINQMSIERFRDLSLPFIEKAGIQITDEAQLLAVLAIVKEKIKHLGDVPDWISCFFTDSYPYDEASVEKTLRKPGALDHLQALHDTFSSLPTWDLASLENSLKETATARGVKSGELIHPARVASTGRSVGPSLYHLLEVLGREKVLQRFSTTIQKFQ